MREDTKILLVVGLSLFFDFIYLGSSECECVFASLLSKLMLRPSLFVNAIIYFADSVCSKLSLPSLVFYVTLCSSDTSLFHSALPPKFPLPPSFLRTSSLILAEDYALGFFLSLSGRERALSGSDRKRSPARINRTIDRQPLEIHISPLVLLSFWNSINLCSSVFISVRLGLNLAQAKLNDWGFQERLA